MLLHICYCFNLVFMKCVGVDFCFSLFWLLHPKIPHCAWNRYNWSRRGSEKNSISRWTLRLRGGRQEMKMMDWTPPSRQHGDVLSWLVFFIPNCTVFNTSLEEMGYGAVHRLSHRTSTAPRLCRSTPTGIITVINYNFIRNGTRYRVQHFGYIAVTHKK